MGMSALDVSNELISAAEKARVAGDVTASLVLAAKAAEYTQLAKILGDAIKENETSETPKEKE